MASSAVIFKGVSKDPKDAAMGTFLDLLEELRMAKNTEPEAIAWLEAACNAWQKQWDEMPPGCKDIELDRVSTTLERRTQLYRFVNAILETIEQ